MTHPDPRRVLIIGGGDGGTLRRVLEHPTRTPTQVEIDRAVIDSCKTHMPAISPAPSTIPARRVIVRRRSRSTCARILVSSTW